MTFSKFIFCFSAGCLMLTIGGLTASLLPTFWFFIAIGGSLSIFSIIQFKRSASNLSPVSLPKLLANKK